MKQIFNLIPIVLIVNFLYFGIKAELGYAEFIPNHVASSMVFGVIAWALIVHFWCTWKYNVDKGL